MCENVNINVSETNETINIVSSEIQEVIDINVFETTEDVTLNITEEIIQVNINKVTSAEITNTSQLINDGEDGVNPFITLEDIPPVTGFVPYTGATQDVDLGEYELKAGQVEFDQTPTGTAGVGVMRWNDSDGTVDLGLKGGNVTLQIGQESVLRVVNKTATNINLLEANYQAVRVTGAQGQRLKVDLAQATNDNLSAETIGLVTETINNNQEGFITTGGIVRNINTTGSLQGETWADGDILYLSPTTAGNVTKVKPTAPNHLVIVGYVVHAHANQGSIFVKVDNGYELDELHNVKITSAANNNVLAYTSATDIWENKTVETALGFTPENVANKSTSTSLGTSNTLYPTQNAVKVYADTKFTLPALTNGSVLFSNGTTIAQDNANLFWDDTNNRLGIGTATPISKLSVVTEGIESPEILSSNSSNAAETAGAFLVRKSRGTILSPSTLQNLDRLGGFYFGGYNGTSFVNTCAFIGRASDNYTTSAQGAFFSFETTATGTNTRTEKMRLLGNGNLLLNTTTDAGFKLDVNGTARVQGALTVSTGGASITGNLTVASSGLISGSRYQCSTGLFAFANTFLYGAGGQPSPAITSGSRSIFLSDASWNQTSGTADFSSFLVSTTINQTGTATGITRGLYIAPTLTSAADWRAIEVSSGITILGASTTAKASLRIPSGTAPTTPTNGDIWFDGTDLKMRIGGVTKTFTLI